MEALFVLFVYCQKDAMIVVILSTLSYNSYEVRVYYYWVQKLPIPEKYPSIVRISNIHISLYI